MKCLAVVPHLSKRRFGSSTLHGKGIVSCRNLDAWSPPAFFMLSDGYWLTPSGVKNTSFMIMFMGQQSRELLSSKNIEIGTDVSEIGGPIGRHVSPQNYYRLNHQMLTYSISKGHLASVSLDGATIREDRSSLEAIYSRGAGTEAVLSGRSPVPATARSFVAAVSEIVQSPRVSD
jgi:SH3 domain-containing YSC84-like protein 1